LAIEFAGREWRHAKEGYKKRNVVERCFYRRKDWRHIATRCDKLAQNFFSALCASSLDVPPLPYPARMTNGWSRQGVCRSENKVIVELWIGERGRRTFAMVLTKVRAKFVRLAIFAFY
jgi:hypothetical protein